MVPIAWPPPRLVAVFVSQVRKGLFVQLNGERRVI